MRVLKSHAFARAARKQGLTDRALWVAALEIESGLVDARLGGFLVKKRIAKAGRGKSGGFRTIVAYRQGDRLVFLSVFAKNEQDNITKRAEMALSEIADEIMRLPVETLNKLVAENRLVEIRSDG